VGGSAVKLGYLQRHMLRFCLKYPGLHYISADYETVRVARSLEKRQLIHMIDCGLSTNTGKAVYMVSA